MCVVLTHIFFQIFFIAPHFFQTAPKKKKKQKKKKNSGKEFPQQIKPTKKSVFPPVYYSKAEQKKDKPLCF